MQMQEHGRMPEQDTDGCYLYLVRRPIFISSDKYIYNIVKMGCGEFPTGCDVEVCTFVTDFSICKHIIHKKFKQAFKQIGSCDSDYFEGSSGKMVDIILDTVARIGKLSQRLTESGGSAIDESRQCS